MLEQSNKQLREHNAQLTENSTQIAENGNAAMEKMRLEIAMHEQSKRKYEDALREWRGVLDSMRKIEGMFSVYFFYHSFC